MSGLYIGGSAAGKKRLRSKVCHERGEEFHVAGNFAAVLRGK
jgi:hypothetical protein